MRSTQSFVAKSPHQTDKVMCAVALDMTFKVALVIKNLALIFGFEADLG